MYWNVPFYFGGTSLLIIVVVVMDFMAQLQAHMMSHQYEGLLRKANLKGYGGGGADPLISRFRGGARWGQPQEWSHESTCIGQEDLPQLQDRAAWRRGAGHLQQRCPAQAAPGLIGPSWLHIDLIRKFQAKLPVFAPPFARRELRRGRNGPYRRHQHPGQQACRHRLAEHLWHRPQPCQVDLRRGGREAGDQGEGSDRRRGGGPARAGGRASRWKATCAAKCP